MNDNDPENVEMMGGQTTLAISPTRILNAALTGGLRKVMVLGQEETGDFYIASSHTAAGDLLLLLELARARILKEIGA